MTTPMLRDILEHGDVDRSTWDGALLWAAITTGFFCLLRSCEYLKTEHGVDRQKCIRWEHLTFFRDGVEISYQDRRFADKVLVFIPYSKTDVTGEGVHIRLDLDADNPLCPVAAFNDLNPKDFKSHPLHAGGASAMYHNGFTYEQIQRRGRWVSDVWKIYVQGTSDEEMNMTQRMSKYALNLIDDGLVGQQIFAGEATRLAYGTDEAVEGRDAFLEKRDPDWDKFPYHY